MHKSSTLLRHFVFGLYLLFFVSIIFSFRAVSSLTIGLLLICGLIQPGKQGLLLNIQKDGLIFFSGCVLLYVTKCFSLFYTKDISNGLQHLQLTSGLLFIPLAVYSTQSFLDIGTFRKLMLSFTAILCIATAYCLSSAFYTYTSHPDSKVFFYHELVKPLSQHAIQFSILLFIDLIFLFDLLKNKLLSVPKKLIYLFILYFSAFLVLLSSKLVLIFYLLYVGYFLFTLGKAKRKPYATILFFLVPVVVIISILITKNPVSSRFREVITGNISMVNQEKFTQGDYFNGVQFRLLQWRFVYEILNENHCWLLGLSPGDAQSFLDKKYISTDMYYGKPGTTDRGFLGYNTHNQFLECLLQNGIIGLTIFLFLCYGLLQMMARKKNAGYSFIILLLLAFNLTDTALETQYGLILFTFFPLFSVTDTN